MSGQILMTPEELKAKARRYGQSSQEIEAILSRLKSLQSELSAEWKGRAFEQFDVQFGQLEPKVRDFAHLMQEINEQLNRTAEAVAQQDEALSRNFGLS